MMLCECLDLVRDLEGIIDATPESDATSSSSSSSSSSHKSLSRRIERISGSAHSNNTGSASSTTGRAGVRGGSGISMAASALARARSHTSSSSNINGRYVMLSSSEDHLFNFAANLCSETKPNIHLLIQINHLLLPAFNSQSSLCFAIIFNDAVQ